VPKTAHSLAPCILPRMKWAFAFAILAVGCGGTVIDDDVQYDDAGNPILDGGPDARRDAKVDSGRDGSRDTSVGDSEPDTWIDPMCPDAPAPKPEYKCDPLKTPPGDCPKGQGCYPWVEYPDDPCEHEIYRTGCFAVGTGTQGDPCSGAMCAAGYACVASGAGNVCVKLCKPGTPGVCPEGLVCHTTDVPGVGGCM